MINQAAESTPGVCTRKRRLDECFKRGTHVATCEKNHDYAHAMFAECVLHDPGNLQYVEAMIQNLRAMTPHAKKWRLYRGSRAIKKALQHKDWTAILRTGIERLKDDPWDVTTLQAMAEACAGLHHNEVELVYLKQALDAEPKNVEVNRHCARSLGRMGQFDQAIACWHRIEMIKGRDEEAIQMISSLAEEKLKYPKGRPSVRKAKETPPAEAEPEPEQIEEVVLTPQQKFEQAITLDPKDIGNYLELAELLLGSNQFNAAETVLRRAITACGDQQSLVEQLERVRSLRSEEQRMLAEECAAEQQTENAPLRIPWLELILAATVAFLVLQLVPSVGAAVWELVDIRNWSRFAWFLLNVMLLLGLIAVRFAPNMRAYARQRRDRRKRRVSNENF